MHKRNWCLYWEFCGGYKPYSNLSFYCIFWYYFQVNDKWRPNFFMLVHFNYSLYPYKSQNLLDFTFHERRGIVILKKVVKKYHDNYCIDRVCIKKNIHTQLFVLFYSNICQPKFSIITIRQKWIFCTDDFSFIPK